MSNVIAFIPSVLLSLFIRNPCPHHEASTLALFIFHVFPLTSLYSISCHFFFVFLTVSISTMFFFFFTFIILLSSRENHKNKEKDATTRRLKKSLVINTADVDNNTYLFFVRCALLEGENWEWVHRIGQVYIKPMRVKSDGGRGR